MKNRIPAPVKHVIQQVVTWIGRLVGITSLTKEQTVAFLSPFQRAIQGVNQLLLPDVTDIADSHKVIFTSQEAITFPNYVWAYQPDKRKTTLLHSGNVLTDGQALCTDFWTENLLKERFHLQGRKRYETNTLVAPFSHYQDGYSIGGYYDFMYLVAAKLCRIENTFPKDLFNRSVVSYPLFKTAYERELLTYIGFEPGQILDSRQYNITFKTCLLGSSGHWFYPNEADVRVLRERLYPLIQNGDDKRERMYISRAGRRRIINEEALICLLEQYNFRIVEDKPRSLAQQLSIYNRASVILGPHGASFSNIIWCQPGTHLVELFSPNYVVGHFRYLAELMGLQYSAYYQGHPHQTRQNPIEEDISVSISDIERGLNALFDQEARKISNDT